jgi:hypothetical protein
LKLIFAFLSKQKVDIFKKTTMQVGLATFFLSTEFIPCINYMTIFVQDNTSAEYP